MPSLTDKELASIAEMANKHPGLRSVVVYTRPAFGEAIREDDEIPDEWLFTGHPIEWGAVTVSLEWNKYGEWSIAGIRAGSV